jgi:outer membrane receptor protein involved in Fe transport
VIHSALRSHVSIAALALAGAMPGAAAAQTSVAPPPSVDNQAAPEEPSQLDEIVVTASGRDKRQLDTSVSVTTVSAETIETFRPSSESEALRLIPGIQVAGTAGPGGNSNIAVRGLPVATGGSPFVQLQEDGLPTVLFGDMQFGNNDYWTRFDASVADVQAVRGGGAATYASQAPGAVINYISHYGEEAGGFASFSQGLGFNEQRVDMRYGGPIGDSTRFHIGGYFKRGRGPLRADYRVSDSYQVKGNITQDFDGGRGYVRLLFKLADTQEPNYTGSPALASIDGLNVSDVKPFPGFDGRRASNYSVYNKDFLIYDRDRTLRRVPMNGITTNAKAIQGQLHYDASDAFTIDDNIRYTSMRGGFASPFLNVATTASVLGSTLSLNGTPYATVAQIRYASGPKAGQVFTDRYVDNNVNVYTRIRDVGSFANDLALAGKFDAGGIGRVTARAGLFYMDQKIAMDWHVDRSLRELSGNNPSQLDLFDAAGNKLTQEGISGYNNNWGNCCARDYSYSYKNTAPYVSLDLTAGRFQIDGSVRFESVKAEGSGRAGGAEFLVNSNGVNIPAITANGTLERFDYRRNYTSWTVGGGYKPGENTNIFARASRGGRFNSDRQTFGGKFGSDGSLCDSRDAQSGTNGCTADGVTPSVDFVNQYEIGVKHQGDLGFGRFSAQLSLLKANFKQSTYELSATRCPGGAGGCVIDAKFKSSGAEWTGTFNSGAFSLFTNATYTKAKRLNTGASDYTRSPNLPDLTYNVVANYQVREMVGLGVAMTGQTSATDDAGREYPGKAIFNGNLTVMPVRNIELGVNVYNLFDTFDLRGNGGVADASVSPTVISGAPALGRTFTGSVKVTF